MAHRVYLVTMEEMDAATCEELLGGERLGRVAFEAREGITVVPVNAVYTRGCVWFRTEEGSALHRLGDGRAVAFEVDHLDEATETGWSVLLRGLASHVDDDATLASLEEAGVHPWAPGNRDRWVCIRPWVTTGRRIARRAEVASGEHLPYMAPG